jgi:nicotinamide-nucleotide amidase
MLDTLKILVLETAKELKTQHLTIATAESCTGGGLSYWLTSVPGSSDWSERGYVTYSNTAKTEMLDVNANTINQYGAVSEETAREMAEGILRHSHADLGIAITGIAGPDGGSTEKPVGTVWIAWGRKNFNIITQHFVFAGDRQAVRLAAMVKALEGLSGIIKRGP